MQKLKMVNGNKRNGISRKNFIPCEKNTADTDSLPPISTGTTPKQKQVLSFLKKNKNPSHIASELKITRNAIIDRLRACERKGLAVYKNHNWQLTNNGLIILNSTLDGFTGGIEDNFQKNQHSTIFTVKLQKLPFKWTHGNLFFQSLSAKDYHHTINSKILNIYYENCTVRINYGDRAKSVSFQIKVQRGDSFEKIEMNIWDTFVKYFKVIEANGFELGRTVTSQNPHFANSGGLFANMSNHLTGKGFRIDSGDISFWVDFSEGYAEEETDNVDHSRRVEQLAESSIGTTSDFKDLDDIKEIITFIPKAFSDIIKSFNGTTKTMNIVMDLIKANTQMHQVTQGDIQNIAKSILTTQNQLNSFIKNLNNTQSNIQTIEPSNELIKEAPYYVR